MFLKKKKYFLFTFGNCFWGYEYIVIKAKDEFKAIEKFLQPKIQNRLIKHPHEENGKKYIYIKDDDKWTYEEIEVIK